MLCATTSTPQGRGVAAYRGIGFGDAVPGSGGGMLAVSAPGTAVKPQAGSPWAPPAG